MMGSAVSTQLIRPRNPHFNQKQSEQRDWSQLSVMWDPADPRSKAETSAISGLLENIVEQHIYFQQEAARSRLVTMPKGFKSG